MAVLYTGNRVPNCLYDPTYLDDTIFYLVAGSSVTLMEVGEPVHMFLLGLIFNIQHHHYFIVFI